MGYQNYEGDWFAVLMKREGELYYNEELPYRTFRQVHRDSLEEYCLINESGFLSQEEGPAAMTYPLPEPGYWEGGKYYLPGMAKDDRVIIEK